MTDTAKIALIHSSIPVTKNKIYLNTGAVGPLSTISTETLKQSNSFELAEGRASLSSYEAKKHAATDLRQAMADLVKAGRETMALTHHTTDGMNIVAHGLSWQPGDEIVTTNLEHPGGLFPLYILRQRHGVVLKVIEIPPGAPLDDIIARFEAAISPRTRLLVFSHVAWNTGTRLPLAKIVAMGHRYGVLSLVDGAQSAGAIPLDLPTSGVDFYAFPGQKWLCGPEGIGGLYIRQDCLSLVSPTFAGYKSMGEGGYDLTGYFMPAPGARRYEVGTVYSPAIKAMVANLAWLEESIGWDWIYARIAHLSSYARKALNQLSGVSLITPLGPQAGLVSFNLDSYDPARVMTKLIKKNIILRFIQQPYSLRISTGFYNTEEDIDRLIAALQAILEVDPDSLPEYVAPW